MPEEPDNEGAGGAAGDKDLPEAPVTRRRIQPSSIGLTVLLPAGVKEIEAVITWGDYRTEPPLPEELLTPPDDGKIRRDRRKAPEVEWVRTPQERKVRIPLSETRTTVPVPDSSTPQLGGGRLELDVLRPRVCLRQPGRRPPACARRHGVPRQPPRCRPQALRGPELRLPGPHRAALPRGHLPRHDLSGYRLDDEDVRIADLHYRDVARISRSAAAPPPAGAAESRRQGRPRPGPIRCRPPRSSASLRRRRQAAGRRLRHGGAGAISPRRAAPIFSRARAAARSLSRMDQAASTALLPRFSAARQETAEKLLAGMEAARKRIAEGIALLRQRRARAPRLPLHERGGRRGARRRECRARRRSRRPEAAQMAPVPARLHPAQPRRPRRQGPSRPRDRRSAVLPDRRRQDRGLSRPRGLRHRASAARPAGEAGAGVDRHHALHTAPADP